MRCILPAGAIHAIHWALHISVCTWPRVLRLLLFFFFFPRESRESRFFLESHARWGVTAAMGGYIAGPGCNCTSLCPRRWAPESVSRNWFWFCRVAARLRMGIWSGTGFYVIRSKGNLAESHTLHECVTAVGGFALAVIVSFSFFTASPVLAMRIAWLGIIKPFCAVNFNIWNVEVFPIFRKGSIKVEAASK